jgi:rhomboid protease GluP
VNNPDPYRFPGQDPGYPASPTGVSPQALFRLAPNAPVVTFSLIGICVAMYLLQIASNILLGTDLPALIGMKVNSLIAAGEYWRLFTPMFLHGSIIHLLFNMYALYVIGPGLERYYGRWRYLFLFLVSGFAGVVASFIFSPAASLGSSTAIFGLLGAQGVFLFQNRQLFGVYAQRALMQVLMIAGINLVIGLSPGIDNWGHMGGLLGGVLFSWFGGPLLYRDGLFPPYRLLDSRSQRDILLSGLIVIGTFATLAWMVIVQRSG